MAILDDIINSLKAGTPVRDVRVGPFQTAVLSRNCGIASTPWDFSRPHEKTLAVHEAGSLIGGDALELARLVSSDSLLEAAIGMASINSLLEIDEARCVNLNGRDLLIDKGRGRRLALVGHFPFVPELRREVAELWVLEKRPRDGDFSEAEAEELIPQADVVGITGTAFTNHTIDHLLSLCSPSAYVIVLGGSAPLSIVLFEYGVDAVSGAKVIDAESVLRNVSQGATFPQLKGLLRLTLLKR